VSLAFTSTLVLAVLIMTLLRMTLFVKTILITLIEGDSIYNSITYN
jgi:hypothetical protein